MTLKKDIVVKKERLVTGLSLGISLISWGCETPTNEQEPSATDTDTESGTITLVANGEAFARQEFVTKDDWTINFDHVYVTLDQVTAYQSDPPFNPDQDQQISAEQDVTLVSEATTIDLAQGDGPLKVTTKQAPAGEYNAIAWQVVSPEKGKTDSAIVLEGTAEKQGETIDFILNLDQPLSYQCGEYVGEVRKGILEAGGKTELETTFHFDHLFGDGEAAKDDEINTNAVGFAPMAELANDNNRLETNLDSLEKQLSSQNYETLMEAMKGLGHVGEGHCQETLM